MPTFYYDYYKIEDFLREFEQKFNLTKLGYDWSNFWSSRKMKKTNGSQSKNYLRDSKSLEYLHEQILQPATDAASKLGIKTSLEWGEFVEKFSHENPDLRDVLVTAKYNLDRGHYGFDFAFADNPSITTSGYQIEYNSKLEIDPEFYSALSIEKRLKQQNKSAPDGMGNILSGQFGGNSSKSDFSTAERHVDEITTNEPVIDGLDVIRLAATGGIALAKIIEAFSNRDPDDGGPRPQTAAIPEGGGDDPDDKPSPLMAGDVNNLSDKPPAWLRLPDLPELLEAAHKLNKLSDKPLPEIKENEDKLLAKIQSLNYKQTQQLLGQTISYLETEIDNLKKPPQIDLAKPTEPNSSPELTYRQRLNSINKRLNSLENTAKKRREQTQPSQIHARFLNYFNSVNQLQGKPVQSAYQVKGKMFDQISLTDKRKNKSICISKNQEKLYEAIFKDGVWHKGIDNLSTQNIDKINSLPQTKQKTAVDYSARYLANALIASGRHKSSDDGTIEWKFSDPQTNQTSSYKFKILPSAEFGQTEILGINDSNLDIFQAKVSDEGLIDIINNQIPVSHVQQFFQWDKSQASNNSPNQHHHSPSQHGKTPEQKRRRSR